jgi:hypothetical protein
VLGVGTCSRIELRGGHFWLPKRVQPQGEDLREGQDSVQGDREGGKGEGGGRRTLTTATEEAGGTERNVGKSMTKADPRRF